MATEDQNNPVFTAEQATQFLTEQGFIVRSKADDDTYVNNTLATEADKRAAALIGEKWKNQNAAFEKKIFEATGIPKNDGENAEAYLLRASSEVKGADSQKLKELYEGQITALKTNLDTKETEIKTIQSQRVKDLISLKLNTAAQQANIAVPGHLTDPAQIQQYQDYQRGVMVQNTLGRYESEIIDGKTVYSVKNDKGEAEIQKDTGTGLPLTESQLIERDFAMLLAPKEAPRGGTGTSGAGGARVVLGKDEDVHAYIQKNRPEIRLGSAAYTALAEELEKSRV